jgi:hypothetical protein
MIDLCAGLGGWAEGGLAEGYDVIGFDIERHVYGDAQYPSQLVLQNILTIHGSQFKNAAVIVASPPCQKYSYMAMPWTLAKQKIAYYRESPERLAELNALFDACFRIQREACEAAGRHIPMVVENVKGAQPWVGRARWNFGSFYLWGDVPALMPIVKRHVKVPAFRFDGSGKSFQTASVEISGVKRPGMNWSGSDKPGYIAQAFNDGRAIKNNGGSWFNIGSPGQKETNRNPVHEAVKGAGGGTWFGPNKNGHGRTTSSKSKARKQASAMIAKIPLELSRHIARTYRPKESSSMAVAENGSPEMGKSHE